VAAVAGPWCGSPEPQARVAEMGMGSGAKGAARRYVEVRRVTQEVRGAGRVFKRQNQSCKNASTVGCRPLVVKGPRAVQRK